jgi:hypothetical protein
MSSAHSERVHVINPGADLLVSSDQTDFPELIQLAPHNNRYRNKANHKEQGPDRSAQREDNVQDYPARDHETESQPPVARVPFRGLRINNLADHKENPENRVPDDADDYIVWC